MRKFLLFFAAISCSAAAKVFAQAEMSDSTVYRQSIQNAVSIYYKAIGENSHLYNGAEYVPFNSQGNRNPFFESPDLHSASISYDGVVYHDVPLVYDIFSEEVIINKFNQNFKIKLVANKIDWFSVYDHMFIRLVHDSSVKTSPATGFYDRIYDGSVTVFAKRKKKLDETMLMNNIVSRFVEDDHFFIKKDGVYYPVSKKKSVFAVFKDRKKDIQKLMRKNKVKFKPSFEFGLVKAAQYYDQVKN
ncbi:MAG: hypothetical protein JST75_16920 [Bacteroidetes bacterium]|nr:hypothetical protein [Bacteroidota bacterium]